MTSALRVAVIGATGLLGRRVVPRLLARGHTVRAVARQPQQAPFAPTPALEIVCGDILDAASLAAAVRGCDVVLHLATAIPRPGTAPDWSRNDQIRREGTRKLLWAATQAGCLRYVQQSIAMLHAGSPELLADEDAPLHATGVLASALDMEQMVQASPLHWVILRGGAFYGPGTDRTAQTNRLARTGRLVLPAQAQHYVSLIHVDDMAEAVVLAAHGTLHRVALNIVDDRPVTWQELLGFVAAQHGAAAPPAGDAPGMPNFRVGNHRARELLGWAPRYPDYRSGWPLD